MEILSVGEFKSDFSKALKKMMSGKETGISYGKKKEVVAKLVPKTTKKEKRRIEFRKGKKRFRSAGILE